ncbi:hypothetical protein EJ03DRAFT_380464 [Teratosphaeria nubilosa]|uniref:Uncharacterized protein n=1 Tax=Teratosphaeria nubilosa TaxID=161662 RepID=A0A6G1LIV2_9PEZI|nr:hypothetical protein EJ03DRAFT_380464 [Teratosphaeria nubilosa]
MTNFVLPYITFSTLATRATKMFFKYSTLALMGLSAISSAAPLSSNKTSTTTVLRTGSRTEPTGIPCWKAGTCRREEEATDLVRGPCWESGTCKRDDEVPDVVTGLPCWKAGTCRRDDEAAARVTGLPCWEAGTCRRGEKALEDSAVPTSLVRLASARPASDSAASSTTSVLADPTYTHHPHGNIPVVAVPR